MFDFTPGNDMAKPELYNQLFAAAEAITSGETDAIANLANLASLMWTFLPDLNWAGFYRRIGPELVLGPFIGRPACIRIPVGKGVCGAAAASGTTQCVDDVHAFQGHIACDSASRSELVVPVMQSGHVVAVIDLDSPVPARFDSQDCTGMERLAVLVAGMI
ncbi:MAG: GAF domain-containing protein [Sphingomonadaceae bacterium]